MEESLELEGKACFLRITLNRVRIETLTWGLPRFYRVILARIDISCLGLVNLSKR